MTRSLPSALAVGAVAAVAACAVVLGAAGCSALPGQGRGATADGGSSTVTTGSDPMRSSACRPDDLTASLAGRDGAPLPTVPTEDTGPYAGSEAQSVALQLTNTGVRPCDVQGWPQVSYERAGAPVGVTALRIRPVPEPEITLRPGQSAQSYLTVRDESALADCDLAAPTALDVVPPGTDRTLRITLPTGSVAPTCVSPTETLLSVQALIPL